MPLTPDDIGRILEALDKSSWDQAEIVMDDVRIAVGRNDLPAPGAAVSPAPPVPAAAAPGEVAGTAPAPSASARAAPGPAAAPSSAAEPTDESASDDHLLTAPSVGVFWRSPSPGAPPFVEVGNRVEVGDTIGIVEVMKLMNNVGADVAGTVTAIFPANAANVEFGTPLVAIRADG